MAPTDEVAVFGAWNGMVHSCLIIYHTGTHKMKLPTSDTFFSWVITLNVDV